MEYIKNKLNQHPELQALLLFILGAAIIVFVTNNYFSILAPFLIAYFIARLLRPLMVLLKQKAKIPNIISLIICMILFSGMLGLILWVIGYYLVDGIEYIMNTLSDPKTIDMLISLAQDIGLKLQYLIDFLHIKIEPADLTGIVTDFVKNAISILSNLSLSFAMKIPSLILSLIIGCVSAFYMLGDYDKIANFINRQLSPTVKRVIDVFNKQVLLSLIKMIFSYALLSIVCFIELTIGFLIMGIQDAGFIAMLIAILDVLPILGSGAILAPWGIIALLMGDPFVGIGMFVLWGIIVIIRQILEPKIVGSQIGLYPLVTIMTLFFGVQLMGGVGLIVAPLYVLTCKKLNDDGIIKLYKHKQTDVEEKINNSPTKD